MRVLMLVVAALLASMAITAFAFINGGTISAVALLRFVGVLGLVVCMVAVAAREHLR